METFQRRIPAVIMEILCILLLSKRPLAFHKSRRLRVRTSSFSISINETSISISALFKEPLL
jgi:hypothetical protein